MASKKTTDSTGSSSSGTLPFGAGAIEPAPKGGSTSKKTHKRASKKGSDKPAEGEATPDGEGRARSRSRAKRSKRREGDPQPQPQPQSQGDGGGVQTDERPAREEGSSGGERPRRRRWQDRRRRRRKGRGERGQGGAQTEERRDAKERRPGKPAAPSEPVEGLLVIERANHGHLRSAKNGWVGSKQDPHVAPRLVQKYALREGSMITGPVRRGQGRHKWDLADVLTVDGREPKEVKNLPAFKKLTSIDPDFHYAVGDATGEVSLKVVDLICPIGRGQRGLIVAPPRSGKTILLQQFAKAVEQVYPEVHLMVLLIDERPEEATEWRRTIEKGEVYVSTNDEMHKRHVELAESVWKRCRRLVEMGEDVILLLDSITRLGRAYNNVYGNSGKTMSGGIDTRALERPKQFFGSARNTETAGSLTILGTTLVETGSRMDQVIFEEFKGTGNMELVSRPPPRRPPHLPRHRHRALGHAQGGEAHLQPPPAPDQHAAPRALPHALGRGHGAPDHQARRRREDRRLPAALRGRPGGVDETLHRRFRGKLGSHLFPWSRPCRSPPPCTSSGPRSSSPPPPTRNRSRAALRVASVTRAIPSRSDCRSPPASPGARRCSSERRCASTSSCAQRAASA